MLLQIATGWENIPKIDQQEIIYLISSVPAIQSCHLEFFFTDGHARSETVSRYTQSNDFDNWDLIYASHWKNDLDDLRRKEKKQAEFLVKGHVPLSCLLKIGVRNIAAEQKVRAYLQAAQKDIPIHISPIKLYYDHL